MSLRGLQRSGVIKLYTLCRYWLPWISFLALIFYFSSLPRPEEKLGFALEDWFGHPVEYAILLFLTFRAFRRAPWQDLSGRYFWAGIVFCLFYAASDELHQFFVPGRCCDIFDFFLDSAGITAVALMYKILKEPKIP